jgi:hypothetical protein
VKFPVSNHLLVVASLLAAPVTLQLENFVLAKPTPAQTEPSPQDPRVVRLHQFFTRLHCPVRDLSEEFVHAADDNDLDWRLLPSISIIESSGGKAYRNNNIFGWANGDWAFPTIRAGLHQVAFRLGKSILYRNRSTEEKLRLYNPDEAYPGRVQEVMQMISPVVNLQAVSDMRAPERSNLALVARN